MVFLKKRKLNHLTEQLLMTLPILNNVSQMLPHHEILRQSITGKTNKLDLALHENRNILSNRVKMKWKK